MKHPHEAVITELAARISRSRRFTMHGNEADINHDLIIAAYKAARRDFEGTAEAKMYYARIMWREATRKSIRYRAPCTKKGNDVRAILDMTRESLGFQPAPTVDYEQAVYYAHVRRLVAECASTMPLGDLALRVLAGEVTPAEVTDDKDARKVIYEARRKLADTLRSMAQEFGL